MLYTGHVIEDMNAHMRLGCAGGHYFRSLGGQDISGIDIVLHQVMPGFADMEVSARIAKGKAGNAFFHYVLPKLGTSLARTEPRMQGRAMCEVFGAYGWAEDTACMKWLMDFLLVRGINRFVPERYPEELYLLAERFSGKGLPVFWLAEDGCRKSETGEAMELERLSAAVRERQLAHLYVKDAPHLRIGRFVREKAFWFMLFWEDVQTDVDETIDLPCQGDFLRFDLLGKSPGIIRRTAEYGYG
nr:hypothetical protein [uncultured Acetatifactor sp.]